MCKPGKLLPESGTVVELRWRGRFPRETRYPPYCDRAGVRSVAAGRAHRVWRMRNIRATLYAVPGEVWAADTGASSRLAVEKQEHGSAMWQRKQNTPFRPLKQTLSCTASSKHDQGRSKPRDIAQLVDAAESTDAWVEDECAATKFVKTSSHEASRNVARGNPALHGVV